ncbi:MAG: GNAT family N-acetyltransferase [Gammaproteobacteria bacterium]|nr:GNAT family N-acetyltransferase [Gammaproteobacteria bacterium]
MMSAQASNQNEKLVYRFATNTDIKAISELINTAYRGDSSRQGWTTEADFLGGQRTDAEEIKELIQRPDGYILLCLRNNELIASAYLQYSSEIAYIGLVAVQPTEQGKGIGRTLLSKAERIIYCDWKLTAIKMSVITLREELICWYERLGYARTGSYEEFPYGEERFGLPKRDDLKFEVLIKAIK